VVDEPQRVALEYGRRAQRVLAPLEEFDLVLVLAAAGQPRVGPDRPQPPAGFLVDVAREVRPDLHPDGPGLAGEPGDGFGPPDDRPVAPEHLEAADGEGDEARDEHRVERPGAVAHAEEECEQRDAENSPPASGDSHGTATEESAESTSSAAVPAPEAVRIRWTKTFRASACTSSGMT